MDMNKIKYLVGCCCWGISLLVAAGLIAYYKLSWWFLALYWLTGFLMFTPLAVIVTTIFAVFMPIAICALIMMANDSKEY